MALPAAVVYVAKVLNAVVGPSALIGAWLKSLGHYGSDISQIDPYAIDGYRYNPADGKWYAAPPQPDYGQWGWRDPAPPEKQDELTNLRRLKLEYEKRKKESPIDNIKEQTETASGFASPIVLDLDGDGVIGTVGLGAGVFFDHAADGFAERTGWVAPGDGLLVWDRNANGAIDSGRELFGSETFRINGLKAVNGFEALRELDTNSDGVIDASDPVYAQLRVWVDDDTNGRSGGGELLTLEEAGVRSINLHYTDSSFIDAQGNAHKQVGSYTTTDGQTRAATDVWFTSDVTNSVPTEWVDVPEDIAQLPDAQGYGKVRDLHQAMAINDGRWSVAA